MNDHLEERLERMLGRRAAAVSAGETLATVARARGQRLIRRRRVTTGVACLAALAVAIPFGVVESDAPKTERGRSSGHHTEIAPVDTPEPTPTPPPEQRITIDLDLDMLSKGAPPEVPWYADGVLHDGTEQVPVGAVPDRAEVRFSTTAYGYLVRITENTDTEPERSAYLLGPDDQRIELPYATTPIVSADGRRLAWSVPESGAEPPAPTRLVTADAATGVVLARSKVVARSYVVEALGFLGGEVVFSADANGTGFTARWDPETGEVTRVDSVERGSDVDADGRLVAELPIRQGANGPCIGVFDLTADDRELWQDCTIGAGRFAVDGSYVVAAYEGKLFDPSTGERRVRIRHHLVNDMLDLADFQLEPDGDLVFVATTTNPGRQAIVRCSPEGDCELATEIHEMTSYYEPAYSLLGD